MSFEYYDLKRALEELQIDESELSQLVSEGSLRAYRDGEEVKFLRSDVEATAPRAHKLRTASKVPNPKAQAKAEAKDRETRKMLAQRSPSLEIDEEDYFGPDDLIAEDPDLFGAEGAASEGTTPREKGPEAPSTKLPIHQVRDSLKKQTRKELTQRGQSDGKVELSRAKKPRQAKPRKPRKIYVKPLRDEIESVGSSPAKPVREARSPVDLDEMKVGKSRKNKGRRQSNKTERREGTPPPKEIEKAREEETGRKYRRSFPVLAEGTLEKTSPREFGAARKAIVVVAMAIVFGLIVVANMGNTPDGGERVEVVEAGYGEILVEVKAPGRLFAEVKKEVKPFVPGTVDEILVRQGGQVRTGQPIIRLRSEKIESDLRSAQTGFDRAGERKKELAVKLENARSRLSWERSQLPIRQKEIQAKIDQAEGDVKKAEITVALRELEWKTKQREYDEYGKQDPIAKAPGREAELRDQSASANLRYETAKQEKAQAKLRFFASQLELQKVGNLGQIQGEIEVLKQSMVTADQDIKKGAEDLAQAKRRQEQLVVEAPIQGTVDEIRVTEKDRVDSSDILVTILQKSKLVVVADVDETDALAVGRGQSVRIRVDALGDREFRGRVLEIAAEGKRSDGTSQVSVFETKIRVLASPSEMDDLRPGLSAQVRIQTQRAEGVLVVPQKAVLRQGDRRIVFLVIREGTQRIARSVEVETGASDNVLVTIESGVREGDPVIVGPARVLEELEDGQRVIFESGSQTR